MTRSNYLNFYIKDTPEEIVYQNFIQINKHQFYQLISNGLLEYQSYLLTDILIHKFSRKPKIFIDNQIHIIYLPHEQALIDEFENGIGKKFRYGSYSEEDKDFLVIFDETKQLIGHLVFEFSVYDCLSKKNYDQIIINRQEFKTFVGIYRYYNQLDRQSQIDILPEHKAYFYKNDVIICSLVNILSSHPVNILNTANFLRYEMNIEFALSPDLQCLALTSENFKIISQFLKFTFFRLIKQENVGQILDQKITIEKNLIARQKLFDYQID